MLEYILECMYKENVDSKKMKDSFDSFEKCFNLNAKSEKFFQELFHYFQEKFFTKLFRNSEELWNLHEISEKLYKKFREKFSLRKKKVSLQILWYFFIEF